jgi:acylphosphatase
MVHDAGSVAMKRGHFTVSGDVQGVGYRMTCRSVAERLGIQGWVRNRSNGDVEVMAEGDEFALGRFRDWCATGPAFGHVSGMVESYSPATGEFTGFEIRP